jgi:hypothetical protein
MYIHCLGHLFIFIGTQLTLLVYIVTMAVFAQRPELSNCNKEIKASKAKKICYMALYTSLLTADTR